MVAHCLLPEHFLPPTIFSVMSPRDPRRAEQDTEELLSSIVDGVYTIEKQKRILCYLLARCFRQDQDVDEMIEDVRRNMENVVKKLEPRLLLFSNGIESVPRRRLSSDRHKKMRLFIKKMAQSYRIHGEISTDDETEHFDSRDDSILHSRVANDPVATEESPNPKKGKGKIDPFADSPLDEQASVRENNRGNGRESTTARRGLGDAQVNKSQKEKPETSNSIRSRTASQREKLKDVEREMSEIQGTASDEDVEMMDVDAVPGEDTTADARGTVERTETGRNSRTIIAERVTVPEPRPRGAVESGPDEFEGGAGYLRNSSIVRATDNSIMNDASDPPQVITNRSEEGSVDSARQSGSSARLEGLRISESDTRSTLPVFVSPDITARLKRKFQTLTASQSGTISGFAI